MPARRRRPTSPPPYAGAVHAPATTAVVGPDAGTPSAPSELKRRLRWPNGLPKPPKGDAPWAMCRPELKGLDKADHALLMRETRAWQELMVPECERLDRERSRRGLKFLYTSEELELALLFGRACGFKTYKQTRVVLAGDDARAREKLGFDIPRNADGQPPRANPLLRLDGVPSEATISRHKKRFSSSRRKEIWKAIERELCREHLGTPELQEEASVLNLDGSPLLTHFRAARTSKAKGDEYGPLENINGALYQLVFGQKVKITCVDGGYVPRGAGSDKSGHGWMLVMISTATGVPLAWRLVPLNEPEKDTALDLVREEFARDVAPYLRGRVKVLTADGAFQKPELRAELRRHGVVENIHFVSHKKTNKAEARARDFDAKRYAIEGYPNWYATGHREIFCRCGKGVSKRIDCAKDGEAIVRVEGKCATCGTIAAKSGDWYLTEDDRFRRCLPSLPTRSAIGRSGTRARTTT